jgi:glycopeptide antibiotics resistance protein
MIFLLHTLIEGTTGLLFLFYPEAGDLVPGFGTSEGPSFDLLMNMYGLTALFLAALSLIAYFSRANRVLVLTISGSLAIFHLGMTIIQAYGNPDPRAMLLHFLLLIFLGGRYVQARRVAWAEEKR